MRGLVRLSESVTCQNCPKMTPNEAKLDGGGTCAPCKVTHHPYMFRGAKHGACVVQIHCRGAHNHLVEKLSCESRFCVLPWSATPQPAATNRALDLVGEFRDARKVVPPVADGIFAWIEHGGFTGSFWVWVLWRAWRSETSRRDTMTPRRTGPAKTRRELVELSGGGGWLLPYDHSARDSNQPLFKYQPFLYPVVYVHIQ